MIESDFILEALDNLAKLGSESALQFGWLSNEYFEGEKPNLISEFGSEDAALHETISFIHDREAAYIVARSTVADRMRVTRYVTRQLYKDIADETHTHPSFHQLRACLVTENGTVVKEDTDNMIDWCCINSWPTVAEIREHRAGNDPTTLEDKRWNRFVIMAKRILLDPAPWYGRYEAANAVVEQDVMEKQHG